MPRQLRNRGGMSVKTIRQKYGIGSFVKERIRKLIPNELADIAVKAAPVVAPFNPLVGAAMRGIGRFDQRGSISDALKQGAGTFAFGVGARKLGGAEGIGGFSREGFSSPLSAERSEAFSALFKEGEKAKNIKDVDKGIKVVRSATEKTLGKIPIVRELPPIVQQQILVGGATAAASAVASYFKGEFREHDPETESFEEYLAQRKKVVGSQMRTYFDNYFKFDKDYSTMTDEEKDQFVARYNVAKGGRIGFQEGSKDNAAKINELVEKGMSMDEAIQKIAPGTKSSVEFTRKELGLGPLKINQEIDELLKEGVDIETIKSITGAPDELIQRRIKIIRLSQEAPKGFMKVFGPNREVMFVPSNEVFEDASNNQMFADAPGFKSLPPADALDTPTIEEIILQKIRESSRRFDEKRAKKKKGGVMSIPVRKNSAGVKELDMRKSGGFVPIGIKEKADDVPAMLSKNEFVMTADAVRGAGDGNINKGAQRMYDTMKKLESRVG